MDSKQVLDRTILITLTGSRAYGISNPDSDSDYKGICIGLPKHYLGFESFEQKDKNWEGTLAPFDYLGRDTVIYELRKFFKLALDSNPNILDILYSTEYKLLTPVAERILEVRDDFVSKKAKTSLSGYAYSQYHKIQTHRKWLLNPPTHEPTLEEFGLSDNYRLDKTQLNAFLEFLYFLIQRRIEFAEEAEILEKYMSEMLRSDIDFKAAIMNKIPEECLEYVKDFTGASDNFTLLLHKQQQYNTAKKAWINYQEWKKNRNRERAVLEAKIGFDSKCGAHLIRLMRMGCEILEGKGVIVDRRVAGDAEEIKAIRNGNVGYEIILDEFERLKQKSEELHKTSTLQQRPKREKLGALCEEIIQGYIS